MLEIVIGTIIASAITGVVGFFLKSIITKEKYLPDAPLPDKNKTYEFVNGLWFLYHFTYDSKVQKSPVMISSQLELSLRKQLIVTGTERVQVDHRRSLTYLLRGQIRAGQFFFTAICLQDPSEVYSGMFPNLLDDEAVGMIVAKDYDRKLYSSPALITKKELDFDSAGEILKKSDINFYSIKQ